ncbi:MAG: dethiobiotin synthase [Leptospira sp.]|nr:dethiobiotin synthase [Leptospira sp.]
MSIIIVATGTNIGKTMVSSAIMAKYGGSHFLHYWKPIQTGPKEDFDYDKVLEISQLPNQLIPNLYEFAYPAAPDFSGRLEGKSIDYRHLLNVTQDHLKYLKSNNFSLLIEQAGGVLVPITQEKQNIDFIQDVGLPVLLVVSMHLGTINHSLLTWESLKARRIPIAGFVGWSVGEFDKPIWKDSAETLERITGLKMLGESNLPAKLQVNEFRLWAKEKFDPQFTILHAIQ